ncbi:MAG: gluconate 2-dehydrogenase subunit 3 family protein [Acidobacteriota bacterium]|nr:gluconate 2-dehydrogenase subunit 3 family protein [Acidobacteriota bacterium]
MKRRQALRSLLSLPALTGFPALAQQAPTDKTKPQAEEKLPPELKPAPVEENPKLAMTAPDAVTPATTRFFTPSQFATLNRLADLLVPPLNGKPGASDAAVPEFLDFLIGQSPQDRQTLYRTGLDRLETEAKRRYSKPFAGITPEQAQDLLAPLRQNWSFSGPADPLSRFLHDAKDDVLRATVSSREWAASGSQRRGAGGVGSYWYSLS